MGGREEPTQYPDEPNGDETNQAKCPFCCQSITNFDLVNIELAQTLLHRELLSEFLHEMQAPLTAQRALLHILQRHEKIGKSNDALSYIEKAVRENDRLYRILRNFRTAHHHGTTMPLTMDATKQMHTEVDDMFKFSCKVRCQGLDNARFQVNAESYRVFLTILFATIFKMTGRMMRPSVSVEYRSNGKTASATTRLEGAAREDPDDFLFNLATIVARNCKLRLSSRREGSDRIVEWSI